MRDCAILADFPDTPPVETIFARWPGKPQGLIPANKVRLLVNNKLVGWCGLHPTTAQVPTGRMTIVGIGGVQVISTERRKGYGRLLVQQASTLATARWKPEALILFSFKTTLAWYEKMGWRLFNGQVTLMALDWIPSPANPVYALTLPQIVEDHLVIESLPW